MKIFIAHENPWNAGNPYIYTLMEEMQRKHSDVDFGWGWREFWTDELFSYDIVHFQWPQAYMAQAPAEKAYDMLAKRIAELHQHGIRIFATCHDLQPHYSQCADYGRCMTLVYEQADVILHLGHYSHSLFAARYPQVQHLLLPHHVYDTVYTIRPTKEESVARLGLPADKTYILCFGSFRSEDERQLVLKVAKQLNDKNVIFLAPSFMRVERRHGRIRKYISSRSQILRWWYRVRYRILMSGEDWVPIDDATLPYYYGLADVAFIQRPRILNSGNAVLPMLFDVAVVGPKIGNVEELLAEYGYPSFDANDMDSVIAALKKGIILQKNAYPAQQHAKVMSTISTSVIAEKLYQYYHQQ